MNQETELDLELSRDQLEELADREAREILHVADRHEAFKMLDRGDLNGTIAQAEFSMLRSMLVEMT